MPLPRVLTALACLLGLVALSMPASALAIEAYTVDTAKHRDGPYDNTIKTANVSKTKSVFMRAVSHTGSPQEILLEDSSGGLGDGDYTVKWFQGKHNVTHDVRSSGREFTLKGNGSKVFRIQLNPKVNNPDPYCVVGDFTRVVRHRSARPAISR